MRRLRAETDWRRADALGLPVLGVDWDAKVIRGYVVAQEGNFKTAGRGRFDRRSLELIVELMNAAPNGLKSRFAHPTLSDDGIGKYLGRARGARLKAQKVRADLHLDPTAFNTPSGDLGGYVMRLAESDADAFSSSLVLQTDKIEETDEKGRLKRDKNGEPLPPIWRPTYLHASDVVDTGDAVDGFLAADGLPDGPLRRGAELIDRQFGGQPREVVEARLTDWMHRYLDWRYGPPEPGPNKRRPSDADPDLRARLFRLELLRRSQ